MAPFETVKHGSEDAKQPTAGTACCFPAPAITDVVEALELQPRQMKLTLRRLSTNTIENWTHLNRILQGHEYTIQRRWRKKPADRRRGQLVAAWPNMHSHARPVFDPWRPNAKNKAMKNMCRTEALLWPYINLEKLEQPEVLLRFLNSRGLNWPSTFVAADVQSALLKESDEIIWLDYEPAMIQFGPSTESYGRLVTEGADLVQKSVYLHAKQGMIAIEIEDRIYDFLLKLVRGILHDIPEAESNLEPLSSPSPILQSPECLDDCRSLSLADVLTYRLPTVPDLEWVKTIVADKRNFAEDHVFMLRNNPYHFSQSLHDWAPVKGFDTLGVSNHAVQMIADAIYQLWSWNEIHRILKKMPSMAQQHKTASLLPYRFTQSDRSRWLGLYIRVQRALWHERNQYVSATHRFPHMSQRSWRGRDDEGQSKCWCCTHTYDWRVSAFIEQSSAECCQLQPSLLDNLVDELYDMYDAYSGSALHHYAWHIDRFDNIALAFQLNRMVNMLYPLVDVRTCMYESFSLVAGEGVECIEIKELGRQFREPIKLAIDLGKELFKYPSDKQWNQTNVEQVIKAEKHLDDVWKILINWFKAAINVEIEPALKKLSKSRFKAKRTQPWAPPIVKMPLVDRSNQTAPTVDRAANLGEPQIESPNWRAKENVAPVKIKTKGVPSAVCEDDVQVNTAEVQLLPKIKITRRAFKTFDALMPTPGSSASSGRSEVSWKEFLTAMNDLGLAPHKVYGSVWMFSPEASGSCKFDAGRSIQFHEPKDVRRGGKIDKQKMCHFGNRLKHAFGWTNAGETFECE